ncbi:D-2-hydroxyacid dehydrogenase [Cryobacterium frigoriphilum]|uniref:D-2-hydroxyacid dehydrogenase n=1 Tax=Cryobacterium frigoriphilum TaxID=1259150 RepID=A0A4R8ZUS6_9MICO|nr:D-2-hydroxyacid dehydrogenase [Cryobacterium frigoriphilum]TFD46914.1 D-2-hydroxyacid dehydrogenase [Cryobacterium frigoriphilum]
MSASRLRVVMATPLDQELCDLIVALEPRIDLVWEPSLLPVSRFATDYRGDPDFRRTPDQQHRYESLIDSADALYGIPDLNATALHRTVNANPSLRWVQTMAAGGGGQVKAAALSIDDLQRVRFTTSAGVHGRPLAEFALFGLLAGAKMLPALQAQQRNHDWPARREMHHLAEQTILVLGTGGIGREVIRLLGAFGVRVLATSRQATAIDGVDEVVHPDDLAGVLPEVDGLVVTLPGTDATAGLVGETLLAAIKPGATLVNVGRGSVVDERALLAALGRGQIGYAALDVFEHEPLADSSPLWDLPNVLVSPHTAALTAAEPRLIAELFARNAGHLLDGQPMLNLVDTVEFY